jgi:hypothetical protein
MDVSDDGDAHAIVLVTGPADGNSIHYHSITSSAAAVQAAPTQMDQRNVAHACIDHPG